MSDFDSPWKEAVDCYFEAFVAFFFPWIHADIDWTRGYETLDKELQQIAPSGEVGRRYVDKLVKVWRKNGTEEWVLIHIEVQYEPAVDFPRRMFIYHYRVLDKYERMVVSLAVLGDERQDWRPNRYEHDLWGCSLTFNFPIVKLMDYASQWEVLEKHVNPFAVLVLAHLKTRETHKDPATRHIWKLRIVKALYERGLKREDIRQMFRFIDWMMDLPKSMEIVFRQEMAQYAEEKKMPYVTSIERLEREEALLEGERIGERKGERKGERSGLMAGIEALLKVKFGTAGSQCMAAIRLIEDVALLQTILRTTESATSLDELCPLWS